MCVHIQKPGRSKHKRKVKKEGGGLKGVGGVQTEGGTAVANCGSHSCTAVVQQVPVECCCTTGTSVQGGWYLGAPECAHRSTRVRSFNASRASAQSKSITAPRATPRKHPHSTLQEHGGTRPAQQTRNTENKVWHTKTPPRGKQRQTRIQQNTTSREAPTRMAPRMCEFSCGATSWCVFVRVCVCARTHARMHI